MRMVNETQYDGRALRMFLYAACKAEGMDTNRTIHVKYARANARTIGWGRYPSGLLSNDGRFIRLLLPRDGNFDPHYWGRVMAHELAHNRGVRHREMLGGCIIPTPEECPTPWAEGIVVPHNDPKAKPKADPVVTRADRAAANLARAEARLKRAKALHRKWAAKVAYYEKKYPERLAAARKG